jgi:hypothetical protein
MSIATSEEQLACIACDFRQFSFAPLLEISNSPPKIPR